MMIEIRNLYKKFKGSDNYILQGISYSFLDTGLYFIIGKSGSGKTTLITLLGGIDLDYEGSIRFNNRELKELEEDELEKMRFDNISYAFQDYKMDENETVYESLAKVLYITSLSKEEIDKRIDKYLLKVELLNKKDMIFKNLSGGEKKRISLIRALLKEKDVIFCDEPLSGLNKKLRKKITEILLEESKNKLVIVITHEVNEIPDSSFTLQLKDKNLKEQIAYVPLKDKQLNRIEHKQLDNKKTFNLVKSLIKNNFRFMSLSFFSVMIAFFSITISFLLSITLSESISSSFSKYMDNNSMVVSKKNGEYSSSLIRNITKDECERIYNKYSDYVENIYVNYNNEVDELFDEQLITLNYKTSYIPIDNISLNSFLRPCTFQELSVSENYSSIMKDTEIALCLKDELIITLAKIVFNHQFYFVDDALSYLNSYLNNNLIYLNMKMNVNKWSYKGEYSYSLVKIISGKENHLINTSPSFSNYFVKDVLHFESKFIDDEYEDERVWTLSQYYGLRLKISSLTSFYSEILKDEEYGSYLFEIIEEEDYYTSEINTHNRIRVYVDDNDKMNYKEIVKFVEKNKDKITGLSFSSNVYTYTTYSYVSGFNKPFFFSIYRDKLNEVEDNYSYSDEDLGQFQASNFVVDSQIVKSDLLSSVNDNSLKFKSIDYSNIDIIDGKYNSDMSKVLISEGLAEKLSITSRYKNTPLYVLSLDRIEKKKDNRYENIFTCGKLEISGIVKDSSLAIYQSSLFPIVYAYSQSNINYNELAIIDALINVDLDKNDSDYYKNLILDYDENLSASFPMIEMNKEIKKTISRFTVLFLSFSIIAFISSFLMVTMAFYLIISKNRRQIGIYMTLGYKKKEIKKIYTCLSATLIIASYLLSILSSLLVEKVLQSTLKEMLNSYKFSFLPYLISFILMSIMLVLIYLFVVLKLKKITVLDSFRK